ncbi:MAG: DUF1778 domain-containing protein [Rickettsiales bacterium]
MRIPLLSKQLLQEAAEIRHKSMTEFVLDACVSEAQNVLAEKRFFSLSAEAWEDFRRALDAPPVAQSRMRQLLQTPTVFDE